MKDNGENISGVRLLSLEHANKENTYPLPKHALHLFEYLFKPLRDGEGYDDIPRLIVNEPQDDNLIWLLADYMPEVDVFCVSLIPKKHLGFDNVHVFSIAEFKDTPRTIEYDFIVDDSKDIAKVNSLITYWGRLKRGGIYMMRHVHDEQYIKESLDIKIYQKHDLSKIDDRLNEIILLFKK